MNLEDLAKTYSETIARTLVQRDAIARLLAHVAKMSLAKTYSETIARTLVQRDAIARLLAHVAKMSGDPEKFFQDFSSAGDARLQKLFSEDASLMNLGEFARTENDWMIVEAQGILREEL